MLISFIKGYLYKLLVFIFSYGGYILLTCPTIYFLSNSVESINKFRFLVSSKKREKKLYSWRELLFVDIQTNVYLTISNCNQASKQLRSTIKTWSNSLDPLYYPKEVYKLRMKQVPLVSY